jgi:MFS family permease
MLPTDVLPRRDRRLQRFLFRGARSMVIGLFIAGILTLVYHHNFWPTLIYSLCIALGCWFFIDSGRFAVAGWVHRKQPEHGAYGQWPGWIWMILIIPIGTVIGYTCGNALGNWITGYDNQGIVDLRGHGDKLPVSRIYAHLFKAM